MASRVVGWGGAGANGLVLPLDNEHTRNVVGQHSLQGTPRRTDEPRSRSPAVPTYR